jgi:hypothetical protein
MKHKLIISLILLPLCCCCFARQKINLNPREAFVYSDDIIGKPSPDVVDKEKKDLQDLDRLQQGLSASAPSKAPEEKPAAAKEQPKIETAPSTGEAANTLSLCKTPCDDVSFKPENYKYLQNIGLVRLKDLCICPKATQVPAAQINY